MLRVKPVTESRLSKSVAAAACTPSLTLEHDYKECSISGMHTASLTKKAEKKKPGAQSYIPRGTPPTSRCAYLFQTLLDLLIYCLYIYSVFASRFHGE